ncbi:MAG: glutamine-hydrolyzing GMP synthase, partial [Mycobacterium sp.]
MESASPRPVLVIDFGAQYAQLIARRVREARVFSEVIPHSTPVEEIKARDPRAIVLSGGPASVYADGAPQLDPAVFELGVPVLGICYGFQAMAQALGGTVTHTGTSEYGRTEMKVLGGELHSDLPETQQVWMSHRDAVTAAPDGFDVVAGTGGAPVAAFEDRTRRLAGVQYHPEVIHTPYGQRVLSRFLHEFAGIDSRWTAANIADALVGQIREQIGAGRAICGLSGGVDSAVAAALVQRAIGDRLTCVFVDHGLLRAGERDQVFRNFVAATGARLVTVDAQDTFLQALSGVSNPEGKRKIIGRQFIRAFESAVRDAKGDKSIEFLVQGTLYPD